MIVYLNLESLEIEKKIVITYFKKTAYQAMNNFNGTFD